MSHNNAVYEKCQVLVNQLQEKHSKKSKEALIELEEDLQKASSDILETERRIKELINWGSLGDGKRRLCAKANLYSLQLSPKAWGISFVIAWVVLGLATSGNIGFYLALILTGSAFFYFSKAQADGLRGSISARVLYYFGDEPESEFPHKFLFRDVSDEGSKLKPTLSEYFFNNIDLPSNKCAIGFFRKDKQCTGYMVAIAGGWQLFTFDSPSLTLSKSIIGSGIDQIFENEYGAIVRLGDLLDEADFITSTSKKKITVNEIRTAWENVILRDDVFEHLLRALVLFAFGDPASPKGILLKGPPGTGKSIAAEAFAKSTGAKYFKVSVADLKSDVIGGSGSNVKSLWADARKDAPSIIFVDECDGIFAKRGSDQGDSFVNEIIQTFLAEWDGIGTRSHVLVIGATNRAELIDDAIISRFSDVIDILPADKANRSELVTAIARQVGIATEIPSGIIDSLGGMSGRDVRNVLQQAMRLAAPDSPSLAQFNEAISKIRGKGSKKVSDDAKWETLILSEPLVNRLKTICQMTRDAESLAAKGIPIPKTLLLYGPPGTGKTQIARTLANEAGLTFIALTTADLKGQYLGHAANRVKQAFESARASSPSIMFIDEIDALTADRGGNSDALQTEAITQLLQELDGVASNSGDVLVIAATNLLDKIDAAILSRFSRKIEIGLPTADERALLLRALLKGRPVSKDGISFNLVSDKTHGYSGRDLRELVAEAFHIAVQRIISAGGAAKDTELTETDIVSAMNVGKS